MTANLFRTPGAILMLTSAAVCYAEKAPDAVNSAVPELESEGTNAALISAVEEQSSVSNEISENANRLSAYGQEAHGISDEVESLSMNTLDASQDLKAKLSIFKI